MYMSILRPDVLFPTHHYMLYNCCNKMGNELCALHRTRIRVRHVCDSQAQHH